MDYIFLSLQEVLDIHDDILKESSGLPGVCPDKSLEAALQRIDNKIFYEGFDDFFEIAALYAVTIAQGHIFNDANKRTAFMSMYTFLKINKCLLNIPEDLVADMMVKIAEKQMDIKEIADFISNYSLPSDPQDREDYLQAIERLKKNNPRISLEDAKKELGLDD